MNLSYREARRKETIKARVSTFLLGFATITAIIFGTAVFRIFTAVFFFFFLFILATYFSYQAMGYRAFMKMADKIEDNMEERLT